MKPLIIFCLLAAGLFAGTLSVKEFQTLLPYDESAFDGDANDYFGESVAISGDTIVVGADQDNCVGGEDCGSVHVYVKNAQSGLFEHKAKLTASDAAAYHYFGYSVAVSGETILVGNKRYDPAGVTDGGAAYLFLKPEAGWSNAHEDAVLRSTETLDGENFGISVAMDGDVAVVGNSRRNCPGQDNCGAAYVFVKPAGGWADMNQTAILSASDAAGNDNFGSSVSLSGSAVVVGANGDDCGTGDYCGAAYVFVKPLGGWSTMTESSKLVASDAQAFDFFGTDVAVNGTGILVGAGGDDCTAGDNCGSAYVYNLVQLGAGDNSENAKVLPSDRKAAQFFGNRVAISASVAAVGAAGAAFLYTKPVGGWKNDFTPDATLNSVTADDGFGNDVAINEDYVVVGAFETALPSKDNAGTAYLYEIESVIGALPAINTFLLD